MTVSEDAVSAVAAAAAALEGTTKGTSNAELAGADVSGNFDTLRGAPPKLEDSDKKKSFSSRPVSTISGNSMTSVDDSQEPAGKQMETQDSLSAMPTPRNTFLCPPTGINLPDSEPTQTSVTQSPTAIPDWASEQHQQQLQMLLEKKGIPQEGSRHSSAHEERRVPTAPSYDDSYCLLSQPESLVGYGLDSREAAIAQLRRLACADRRGAAAPEAHVPPLLAPSVDALSCLEDALMGVLARRSVPNRTLAFRGQKGGGAGFSATSTSATGIGSSASILSAAGKSSRRKQRMSMMSGGQDGSAGGAVADDRRSTRSRVSVMSGDLANGLSLGATPYSELNAHMERLTACITRLKVAASPDSAGLAKPPGGGTSRPPSHRRQSSVGSLGAKSFSSAQSVLGVPMGSESTPPPVPMHPDAMQLKSPSHTRLPPVNENPSMEDAASAGAAADDAIRPRSSSHASVVSGASTESRRRIVVNEVPKSSQYPNLFGHSVLPTIDSQERPPTKPTAPSVAAASIHSSHSESSQTSGRALQAVPFGEPVSPPEFDRASSVLSKPMSKSGIGVGPSAGGSSGSNSSSAAKVANAPAITVREITPASRLALWLNMHSTVEVSKPSLWRRKQWHRRFAIFAGNVIYLYKSSSPAATALSVIRLNPHTIVCVNDSFQGRSWVIEVTQPPLSIDSQTPSSPALSFTSSAGGPLAQTPQSWYLQTEMRSEMITLLKQLKGAVSELQVQPDVERKEEERLRNRRRKQRKEAKTKTDVCPWEVDEFTGAPSSSEASDYSDCSDDDYHASAQGMYRIPDEDLYPSEDEVSAMQLDDSKRLEAYSMGGNAKSTRPAMLNVSDYTGTGGIAEWGAHRLQVPFSNSAHAPGSNPVKLRSFSTDPSATSGGRRPSLADALAPPPSAMQELTPVPRYSPATSPKTPPAVTSRSRSILGSGFSAMRNSMMLRSDASALIDQMFASASRELSGSADSQKGRNGSLVSPGSKSDGTSLFVVREED
ncbi:hypothetical protein LPJ53_002543 [Coemansia erecta]|uniref:PH domain-containing protein n=1 Tax=Coemansia erecta TaxID=147472 RepID=A0A9W8CTR5_9FUNG|nr:hypothetical protein LPJ53_002543 [Coemansia erecta]